MKKRYYVMLTAAVVGAMLLGCNAGQEPTSQPTETPEVIGTESGLTRDMAFEGVNNYCHETYDWSAAEGNPDIMYVEPGEETETEYQVVFRSYTGALVYFYVDKTDGTTRMTEYEPTLDVESDAGTISLYDYLG